MLGGAIKFEKKKEHPIFYTIRAIFWSGTNYLLTENQERFRITNTMDYLRHKYFMWYTIKQSINYPDRYVIINCFKRDEDVSKERPEIEKIVKKLGFRMK